MKPPALSLAVFLLFFVRIAFAADEPRFDESRLRNIPRSMHPFIDHHEIAGAVTLVATREKVVALDAVGEADVAGRKPMKPDSIFWIASMTKPVTATAVMMLQDEGKLSVNDPVEKYIPQFKSLKGPSGQPAHLTLHHLLTHTSGLAEATVDESRAAHTLADLIPHFLDKPMQFEPGSKWQYCQSGINTLGRIIEVVSGASLPDFFQKRLFEPLGMKDTTFYPNKEQLTRLATSYKRNPDGTLEPADIFILDGKDPDSHDHYPAANGGLFSTAPDYGRFCRMLLNNGALDGKQYLTPKAVKQMSSVQSGELKTGFTPGNGWGLGVCVVRNPQGVSGALSPGSFGHGGAYGTQAWIDPVKGVAYVLMVQRANFPNSDDSPVRKAFQDEAAAAITR